MDGNKVLLRLGERAEEARQLLSTIREQKFDRLVPIYQGEREAVALLVKSR
jgi:hypothetical protein